MQTLEQYLETEALKEAARNSVISERQYMQQFRGDPHSEYKWKRVCYPTTPPLVFDCRFEGAAEQIVQKRYQSFVDGIMTISNALNTKSKRLDCHISEITPKSLKFLHDSDAILSDPVKMCFALKHERMEIASQVAKDIGRYCSSDELRRIGIGDQIVLLGIIQSAAEKVGGDNVTVIYDPLYPGSAALANMSGLRCIAADPSSSLADHVSHESNVIPITRHPLEHPLSYDVPCWYGEEQRDPAAQMLWNLGWEGWLTNHKVGHPRLLNNEMNMFKAKKILGDCVNGKFLSCQPLEATRLNECATAESYSYVIQMIGIKRVLFGSSPEEKPKLERFIKECNLPHSYHAIMVNTSLECWRAIMTMGDMILAGNTSGMWLGFSTETPITIMSKSDKRHGIMWNAREGWFTDERFKTINILE